jgi:hypothetical protein
MAESIAPSSLPIQPVFVAFWALSSSNPMLPAKVQRSVAAVQRTMNTRCPLPRARIDFVISGDARGRGRGVREASGRRMAVTTVASASAMGIVSGAAVAANSRFAAK